MVVSLVFLVCFLILALFRGAFSSVDVSVNMWAASINNSQFTLLAEGISIGFGFSALAAASVIIAAVFYARNYREYSLLLLFVMFGDILSVSLVKVLVSSSRPVDAIIYASGYSFPSGHVAGFVALFGVLTYFVWKV